MRKGLSILLSGLLLCIASCTNKNNDTTMSNIDETIVQSTIAALQEKYGDASSQRFQRSVPQVASLWTAQDGTPEAFKAFCLDHFVADSTNLVRMANTLQSNLESLWGCFNKISVDLKLPLHVVGPEPTSLDELFGGFDPSAHFDDDMFEQKIAFITVLNFPFYTLD